MSYDNKRGSSRISKNPTSSAAKVAELRLSLRDLKSENNNLRRLIQVIKSNPNIFLAQDDSQKTTNTSSASSSSPSGKISVVSSGSTACVGVWRPPALDKRVSFAGTPSIKPSPYSISNTGPPPGEDDTETTFLKESASTPSNESRKLSQLSERPYTARLSASSVVPSRRILGEIAYQLERRILGHIFSRPNKVDICQRQCRRFYGYTVSNLAMMIRQESTKTNGKLDEDVKFQLNSRVRTIAASLRHCGYQLVEHGIFAQQVINKHGLMRIASDSEAMELFGLADADSFRGFICLNVRNAEERKNMLILLECLLFLANNDGKSVFLW